MANAGRSRMFTGVPRPAASRSFMVTVVAPRGDDPRRALPWVTVAVELVRTEGVTTGVSNEIDEFVDV